MTARIIRLPYPPGDRDTSRAVTPERDGTRANAPEIVGRETRLLGSSRRAGPAGERLLADDDALLDRLTAELLRVLEPAAIGDMALVYVTVSPPPALDARDLVAELTAGCPGYWFVICASATAGTHAHGVMLAATLGTVRHRLAALRARYDLHAKSSDQDPVRGWRKHARGGGDGALAKSLHYIARYSLALGERRDKRAREVPVDVMARGVFAGTGASARPALASAVTLAGPYAATVTPCPCGCGGCVPPMCRYHTPQCAARERQRRHRARVRDAVTPRPAWPQTVTRKRFDSPAASAAVTSGMVAVPGLVPARAAPAAGEIVTRAAREALDFEGCAPWLRYMRRAWPELARVPDSELERACLRVLAEEHAP